MVSTNIFKGLFSQGLKPNLWFFFRNKKPNYLVYNILPIKSDYPVLFYLSIILALPTSCTPETKPMHATNLLVNEKLVWVYTHSHKTGIDYTVFSPEKPINKGDLPRNFLAIKNKNKETWNCLLKWEGDVLWFYTPSSRSFASHNSEDGKTKWTIIEEKDFNYFFNEDHDSGFIRFSNECGIKDVLCLDSEEIVIGE